MAHFSIVLLLIVCVSVVYGRSPFNPLSPVIPQRPYDESPAPYDFNYKVENPPTNTFFGQSEASDQAGRVAGSYYVYLPDGRLMTVEYTVDGESGFLPRISFQNQAAAPSVRGR